MGKKFLIITVTINVLSPLISLRDRTFFIHQPQAIHSIYHYRYFLNTRQRLKTKVTSIYSDIPEFKYRSKGFYFSIIIIVKPDYLFLQAISLFYSLQSKSCLFRYTYVLVCVLCISCLINAVLILCKQKPLKIFFRTTRVLKKLLYAFHENPEVFAEQQLRNHMNTYCRFCSAL